MQKNIKKSNIQKSKKRSKKVKNGGGAEARTLDPLIKSQLLYQLSYTSKI